MKSVVFLIHKGRRGARVAGPGRAGRAGLGQAGPGRAGRAGPGRHRLELDLGSILGGQAGGRFGSHFGGPNHLFALSSSFTNWVHLQTLNGLGMRGRNGLCVAASLKTKMSPNERENGE